MPGYAKAPTKPEQPKKKRKSIFETTGNIFGLEDRRNKPAKAGTIRPASQPVMSSDKPLEGKTVYGGYIDSGRSRSPGPSKKAPSTERRDPTGTTPKKPTERRDPSGKAPTQPLYPREGGNNSPKERKPLPQKHANVRTETPMQVADRHISAYERAMRNAISRGTASEAVKRKYK